MATDALGIYDDVVNLISKEGNPIMYGHIKNNQGICYYNISGIKDRAKNLIIAITAYNEALKTYTLKGYPVNYATTQANLGVAYQSLAELRDGEKNLSRASQVYSEALNVYTIEYPKEYAMVNTNLGDVSYSLAGFRNNKENLTKSIDAYRNALKVYTIESHPEEYAMTETNLGPAGTKQGPESMRIGYAKALRREIDKLKENIDFILIGDFNSNYNEYKTFRNSGRLNDTNGITGINHILKTIKDSEMVNEKMLTKQAANEYLYNLWLEVSKTRRWSYNFFGEKGNPDNIIVSKGLYDDKGISYIDNSFNKFQPDYLFKGKTIYRWQMVESGRGKHLGKGYSDHLPIFAYFSTEPFLFKNNDAVANDIVPQGLLDLNTAGKEELMSINGIGPVLSARIIAGRPYRTVDDLLKVKGIGPKKLENIRPYFVVDK